MQKRKNTIKAKEIHNEDNQNIYNEQVPVRRKTVKKPKYEKIPIKHNDNLYLYTQIVISAIFVVTSVLLRFNGGAAYNEINENYKDFFKTENIYESNFSYSSFADNLKEELSDKYQQFMQTAAYIYGKGSGENFADNVSMAKYVPTPKGIKPLNGYISSPFGIRKDPFNKYKKDLHTGVDIAAAKGTFIKAAFGGEVTETGYSEISGNYIKIKNNDVQQTFYGHTQFVFVKKGEKVLQGQVIATVGDTGLDTGPHLHFEVLYKGNRVNPIYTVE